MKEGEAPDDDVGRRGRTNDVYESRHRKTAEGCYSRGGRETTVGEKTLKEGEMWQPRKAAAETQISEEHNTGSGSRITNYREPGC